MSEKSARAKILKLLKDLESYINTYRMWIKSYTTIETEQTKESKRLYSSLLYYGYFSNDFKYGNILTEKGTTVKEEIDNLQIKGLEMEKESYILNVLNEVKSFFNTYKEWPTAHKKVKNEKEKLSNRLYDLLFNSGFISGKFLYKEAKTIEGNLVEEELNDLFYEAKRVKALEMLKRLKNYVEIHKKWPIAQKDPKTDDAKEANNLINWLRNIKVKENTTKFNFGNILTEEGTTIKEEIESLKNELKKTEEEKKALEMLSEIKEYYKTYEEWPKQFFSSKGKKQKASRRICNFLKNSGFYSETFKYKDVKTKEGTTIKEELDKILNEIEHKKVIKMFNRIKAYYNTYEKWPGKYKNPKNNQEREGSSLRRWLDANHYKREDNSFQYKNILTEDRRNLKEELDILYDKYHNREVLRILKELKVYCETYKRWPKIYSKATNDEERLSHRLAFFLYRNGYHSKKKEFKYKDIITDSSRTVIEEIDELFNKYANLSNKSEIYILKIVNSLKEYCEAYHEFPRSINAPTTEKEKESRRLYNWLNNNGYFKGKFNYINIKSGNISIKSIIDYYYFMYGVKDIWIAKDSHDLGTKAYYYIINIWKELDSNNDVMINYYYESLKNLLGNRFSNFNLEEIMDILKEDLDTISNYFLHKYLTCSIENDTWIYFYKSLYEYSLYKKENTLKNSK